MSPTGRYGPISPADGSFSGEAVAAPANVGFVPVVNMLG